MNEHPRKHLSRLPLGGAGLSRCRFRSALGRPLPAETSPSPSYTGPARLIVPTVRNFVSQGEALALEIIALDQPPVKSVTVKFRPLGKGEWQTVKTLHQARAVWQVKFPPATEDFEYSVEAQAAHSETLRWPASAPDLNQTVVVIPIS